MYNIDLTFLQTSILEDRYELHKIRYNKQYHQCLINQICPSFYIDIKCQDCNIHAGVRAEPDERRIIEAESKGLMGRNYCEVLDDSLASLEKNDVILVKLEDFIDIAVVDEVGDIVRLRRQRLGLIGEKITSVLRKVTEEDLRKYEHNICDEQRAKPIFREKVEKLSLNMKLVDVHFQFDRRRLFFFYTSDGRVDFRELAKELAAVFKTRIELRQIGVRDEAKRLGGLGACGREYCCSSFLYSFKRITTQIATDQNLSTNLSKLSGPCGKLKCCLSFELTESDLQ